MSGYKKVFVVDDDEFYLQMLVDHLSKLPALKVQSFGTGEECITQLYKDQPDLVILDYVLNDVKPEAASGLVILEKIRKAYPLIHVIMLSGQGKYGVAASTISKGAEHYVVKDDDSFKKISSIIESYR